VIWATGFTRDYAWIHAEGVHFLGMSWQRTRGSALLGWVGGDAERLVANLPRVRAVAPTNSCQ
jgi:putative flavoprotein involved in K+ transport